MKFISADHSGGPVEFDAVVDREAAESFAKNLKKLIPPTTPEREAYKRMFKEQYGYEPRMGVKCRPKVDTFLRGGKKLRCEWSENCVNNVSISYIDTREGAYIFNPDDKKDIDLFRVRSSICGGDLMIYPDKVIDPLEAYYGKVGSSPSYYVDIKDIERDIDASDLFGREDD